MAVASKTGFAECVVGGYTAAQSSACHECGTAVAAGRQQTNERLGSSEKVCVWGGDGVWLPYRTVCLDSARVGLGAPVTLERYGCATRSTASTRASRQEMGATVCVRRPELREGSCKGVDCVAWAPWPNALPTVYYASVVTIRGVDIGRDVLYAADYPSERINAGLVVEDLKSYLLFSHAGDRDGKPALPEDRESVQRASFFKCVDSLQDIDALAAVLYRNRVRAMPKAPAEHEGSTFDDEVDKLFLHLPFWHPKHPRFDRDGDELMNRYESEVAGVLNITSADCARLWWKTLEDDTKATRTWWWQRGRTLAEIKTLVQPIWENPDAQEPEPLEPMPKELLDDGLGDLDDDFAAASN